MAIASVAIDQREPEWARRLTFGGVPTVVGLIETDYLVLLDDGTVLGIERKSSSDLLTTLRDGRLFPQLAALRDLTPWAYLVICGELRSINGKCFTEDGRLTGWKYAAVQGALLTCQEIGVHVVSCPEADFEQQILRLAHRERRALRVAPARETLPVSEGEQLLSALPGIGPEKAATLLSYCGSAAAALWYLTDDGGPVGAPGVGNGTRQRVRTALGLDPTEVLHPVDRTGVVRPVKMGARDVA